MNLTGKQWLAIAGAVLSVLMVSTAQLTDIFGAGVAKNIVSIAGLGNMILSSVLAAISGQANLIRDVAAIQGDDGKPAVRINVNANAPATLASAAVDPAQPNIGAVTPEVRQTLLATAGVK